MRYQLFSYDSLKRYFDSLRMISVLPAPNWLFLTRNMHKYMMFHLFFTAISTRIIPLNWSRFYSPTNILTGAGVKFRLP